MAALVARDQASSDASAALSTALSADLRVQLRVLPTDALDTANRLPTSQP